MNRPLFLTTLSIPSYDIGKYDGLRTYQHPVLFEIFIRGTDETDLFQETLYFMTYQIIRFALRSTDIAQFESKLHIH